MSDAEITRLRDEIGSVDRELVTLVAKRLHLAAEIGLEKKVLGRPVRDEEAEGRVRARIARECATQSLSSELAGDLSSLLIQASIQCQERVRLPDAQHRRVLVVGGAGQMGSWLCRHFRSRGFEVLVNDSAGPLEGFPFEPDLAAAVKSADVIVVSVPISVSEEILRAIARMQPHGLIFDVCSLKAPVDEVLRGMGQSGLRVASVHPVFGPNLWPLSAGTITFSDCGNRAALTEAKELFRSSGARLVDVPLDRHDELMAVLLGVSHLSLLTFARSVSDGPVDVVDLAGLKRRTGTTFSRLASAAAGLLSDSPQLLRDIQALNPHTPAVHRRIREAFDEWVKAARDPDAAAFIRLVESTHKNFDGGTTS